MKELTREELKDKVNRPTRDTSLTNLSSLVPQSIVDTLASSTFGPTSNIVLASGPQSSINIYTNLADNAPVTDRPIPCLEITRYPLSE